MTGTKRLVTAGSTLAVRSSVTPEERIDTFLLRQRRSGSYVRRRECPVDGDALMAPGGAGRRPSSALPGGAGADQAAPARERSHARRAWAANEEDLAWLNDLLSRGA